MIKSTFFENLFQRRGLRQFVKFGIVGASGLAVNLGVFTLLQMLVPVEHRKEFFFLLSSIAYMTGGVSNYFLNRTWTFRSSGHPFIEAIQFLGVSLLSLGVGLTAAKLTQPWVGTGHRAQLVVTACGIVVNFFVNKYWTFRSIR
ncbi:MAG TPA: GtrA family protein [Candidatus Baltobacteraceae bacterium]|jgi:dolichol-phosphate mannosyltransferase|nr:GtrA family protein [Candidatus Baltobacteraceae bacterium]